MAQIVTGWEGDDYGEIAAVTVPLLRQYASRHGHGVTVCAFGGSARRSTHWKKLTAIAVALERHEEVLWIDADVVVTPTAPDIFAEVPPECRQALVVHHSYEGEIPNTGVWVVKRTMLGELVACAMADHLAEHRWRDQAAVMDAMWYEEGDDGVSRHVTATGLYRDTHRLGEKWNWWRESPADVQPLFRHAFGHPWEKMNIVLEYANACQHA